MAWTLLTDVLALTPGEGLWRLKEYLVSKGWSVPRSGLGSGGAYSSSGDVHAPGSTYAGTLDLADAWFELRQPASVTPRRSFLFKNVDSTGRQLRLYYSSNGTGFTGGSPSATALPTATDSQGLINTPTGTTNVFGAGPMRLEIVAGELAEGFSFFAGFRVPDSATTGTPGYDVILMLDVLEDTHASDTDPAVVGQHFGTGSAFGTDDTNAMHAATTATQTGACIRGWYKKGLSGATFVEYPCVFLGIQESSVDSVIPHAKNRRSETAAGDFNDLPIHYWRGSTTHTTQRGHKGKSRLFRDAQIRLGTFRPNNDLTRMSLGPVSIPWDGTSRPIF